MKKTEFEELNSGDVIRELPSGRSYVIQAKERDPRGKVMLVLDQRDMVAIWPPGWQLVSKANGRNGHENGHE